MHSSTDNAWKTIGEKDPYFGVLTQPKYHRDTLDEERLEEFFRSGAEHVQKTLQTARTHLDAPERFRSVLDFGCGVGRLTIPFAAHADSVTGVDISPAMLEEAGSNTRNRGLKSVDYALSERVLESDSRFELVHTYIVLQHVATGQGTRLFERLIELIEAGGYGVLHLTYAKTSRFGLWHNRLRKWVPLLNPAINLMRGRPASTPMMQMNNYDLNRVHRLLQTQGINEVHTVFTDHGGNLGVSLFFKKPTEASAAQRAA